MVSGLGYEPLAHPFLLTDKGPSVPCQAVTSAASHCPALAAVWAGPAQNAWSVFAPPAVEGWIRLGLLSPSSCPKVLFRR